MRPILSRLLLILALGFTATFAAPLPAIAGPIWTGEARDQPAIGGHDAVSYFAGAPLMGSPDFTTTIDGAVFRFANAANLATFKGDPARYTPQYGGYCAWAASQQRRAGADPKVWKIVDGKLYLNCSKDAETKWQADRTALIAKADAWWATQK